jgi:hypothetical protein
MSSLLILLEFERLSIPLISIHVKRFILSYSDITVKPVVAKRDGPASFDQTLP